MSGTSRMHAALVARSTALQAARRGVRGAERRELLLVYGKKLGLSLDYVPTNIQIYQLALSGSLAGMLGGRSILLSAPTQYAPQVAAAAAWAQEIDGLWASAAAIDSVTAELMMLESYAAFDGRGPPSATDATASAVIAAIQETQAYLRALGITPTPWIGSGGSSSPMPVLDTPGPETVPLVAGTASWNVSQGTEGSITYSLPGGASDAGVVHEVTWGTGANAPEVEAPEGYTLKNPINGENVPSYTYQQQGEDWTWKSDGVSVYYAT